MVSVHADSLEERQEPGVLDGFHLSYCDCYFMSSSFNTGLLSQQGCMRDTEASCCTGS